MLEPALSDRCPEASAPADVDILKRVKQKHHNDPPNRVMSMRHGCMVRLSARNEQQDLMFKQKKDFAPEADLKKLESTREQLEQALLTIAEGTNDYKSFTEATSRAEELSGTLLGRKVLSLFRSRRT